MNKYLRWIPALVWMIFIFYLSGRQTTGITGIDSFQAVSIFWQRFIILKFFHLVEYGILFALLFFASGSTPKSFFLGYLYACTDEFHQTFIPGRTAKFSDTFIDLIGMFLGWLLIKIFLKLISKKTTSPS